MEDRYTRIKNYFLENNVSYREVKHEPGCDYGELPPVGKIFNLRLFMDKDFLNEQETFMNAGRVDISFIVNPLDLQRLENPVMV